MAQRKRATILPFKGDVTLDTPLSRLIGRTTVKSLQERLDIETAGDLLRHYPLRYVGRGELTDLTSLYDGEEITVLAEVVSVRRQPVRSKNGGLSEICTVVVTDGRGTLDLTFFAKGGPRSRQSTPWPMLVFRPGMRGLFAGKVKVFRGRRQIPHPDYILLSDDPMQDDSTAEEFTGELLPIYRGTTPVPSWEIWRCIREILKRLVTSVPDPIPPEIRERHGLLGLRDAFFSLHRPISREDAEAARRRFRFEEAFVLQTELARRRLYARELPAVPRVAKPDGLVAAFDARLPFTLTAGQREVCKAIEHDLARSYPMQRLLQGEVGSGKTVCAVRAMLTVVDAGGQAALLAPTEVLAQQHYRSIVDLLGPLAERGMLGGSEHGTKVVLLTGSQSPSVRRRALLDIASGEAGLVIGTHALLEEKVTFADLGLVVIDEQHRFGVEQRAALTMKNDDAPPHVLVMTATPIPRTVAMTVFGDLEVSTLRELPLGRASVQTTVVPVAEKPEWLERVWQRIGEEVAKGRQAYVVCPRIGGDSTDEAEEEVELPDGTQPMLSFDDDDVGSEPSSRSAPTALVDLAAELAENQLAGLRVGVLHGRMPSDAKDAVMRQFAAGDIDVLVATTVIEVGVDVPNASVMVVMDADWYGVSQLHQLRGRIGRGAHPGLCLLVTSMPAGTPARERLDAVASTSDGFTLSRIDLQQRREGDVLGAMQHGRKSSLRLLRVVRDEAVIEAARAEATEVVERDPQLIRSAALREAVRALYDADKAEYLEKT